MGRTTLLTPDLGAAIVELVRQGVPTPSAAEAVGISLWDQKENADAYSRETYPEVLKTLGKVVQGIPQVQTHEVSSSTFHKITAHAAA